MENEHEIIDLVNEAIRENLGINSETDKESERAAKSILSNLRGKSPVLISDVWQKQHSEKVPYP